MLLFCWSSDRKLVNKAAHVKSTVALNKSEFSMQFI